MGDPRRMVAQLVRRVRHTNVRAADTIELVAATQQRECATHQRIRRHWTPFP
ncbi:hypothetical protein I553_8757 [Mycobacterium xenopi 4042]|uniref:Uncharacterized protein n=1 Tax=Mycobacterium xenopi 4042 TaxID=1299334 RepID=X8CMM5_MYCXE|nr:hypothetical protein I553_8757 [Mycobacterium xenopi 4042]